ncbi:MAG: helix-turn-helix domain-containing protein [Actinobacteria bacterium]|nr:helix-turn-helix domain-containing protein [Actinomycetota bacterium]
MARRPRQDTQKRHVVAAIIPADASLLELSAATEVFGIERPDLFNPWYELRVCGVKKHGQPATYGGVQVIAPHNLAAAADADTLIAMPWGGEWGGKGETPAPPEVLQVFCDAHARGARLLSFCTGAFVLAAAGVLRDRRVTTHWRAAEELARRYPDMTVDPDVLYVDGGQVLTSAGAAASFDLALHVVRVDHGADVANAVARGLVVPPHRDGGQAQYVGAPVAPEPGPDPFRETLDWALEHLGEPLSVGELAGRSLMSPRTFARHFRAVVGATPHQWLLRQRVLAAQQLLETTDRSIDRIADDVGFGSAATLRMHFQRVVHTTPQAYRRTFAGDVAATGS